MFPEIGQFSLILSLFFALSLAVMPLLGYWKGNRLLLATARPLTFVMSALIAISFLSLSLAFLRDDFSVLYVSQNSNSQLPVWYKFSALWGGHEGSFVVMGADLIGMVLCRRIENTYVTRGYWSYCSFCIGRRDGWLFVFLLFTSSPFVRL
ncbi:heme lyase NrfEFG subunit NrfE, partial [Marinomonas pontica]|nr:heme lyase NrfEFG subunit NrfE [Marinomonas pontica]